MLTCADCGTEIPPGSSLCARCATRRREKSFDLLLLIRITLVGLIAAGVVLTYLAGLFWGMYLYPDGDGCFSGGVFPICDEWYDWTPRLTLALGVVLIIAAIAFAAKWLHHVQRIGEGLSWSLLALAAFALSAAAPIAKIWAEWGDR